MNDIGELLKETRTKNGVSVEEASEDLNYKVSQLKAIEDGDYKGFKDIFLLKCIISDYSKYLGLDSEKIMDEFNEYIFESTSKIPIDDIERASKQKEEAKIASPYTKKEKEKSKLPLILGIILGILILAFIVVTIYNNSKDSTPSDNVKIGVVYEKQEITK